MMFQSVQQFFLYGGYVIGILLFASVLAKRKTHHGYLLVCFLIVLALTKQTLTFTLSNDPSINPFFLYYLTFLNLLTIPPVYFYVRYFIDTPQEIANGFWKHISIFAAASALLLLAIYSSNFLLNVNYQVYICRICTLFVSIPYFILVFKTIKKFELGLKEHYSDISKIHLSWLRLLLAIYFIHILVNTFDVLTGPNIPVWKVTPIIATLSIFALAYFSMKQSRVFEESKTDSNEIKSNLDNEIMSPVELEKYKDKLLNFLDDQKPYLDPHITLKDLSSGIGLKPYKLSFLINNAFQTHFYNLINIKRIDHAKKLLLNPQNGSNILEVAIESGFNSKSVFNDAFKKHSGMTPSQFRNSMRPSR